jgi:methionine-S-sulfoxide reductase
MHNATRTACLLLAGGVLFWDAGVAVAEDRTRHGGTGMAQAEQATFAGGCFWCMEPPFEKLPGVIAVTAGYTGGTGGRPTYEQVSSGTTGHAEAVQVLYDPSTVSYEELLETFWRNVDPTQADGQFADKGSQYRTAVFYHAEEQRRLAEASRERLGKSGKFDKPIVTEIAPAGPFYPAEDYHQDYYKKNPLRYKLYRAGSGREGYLQRTWGDEPRAGAERLQ